MTQSSVQGSALSPNERKRAAELDLAQRLLAMAERLTSQRNTTLAIEAVRAMPEEVALMRQTLFADEAPRLVDAECACMVELMIALSFAREAGFLARVARLRTLLETFMPCVATDIARAARIAGDSAGNGAVSPGAPLTPPSPAAAKQELRLRGEGDAGGGASLTPIATPTEEPHAG